VKLHGAGFIVTREEAPASGLGAVPGLERHIREYRNGRDLMATPRDVLVIDAVRPGALSSCVSAFRRCISGCWSG
jgi:hypothetical protein